MELVAGFGARFCQCRLAAIRSKRLGQIPPKFAQLNLTTLEPKLDAHPKQAKVIPFVKENPGMSYVFAGDFGCGKSMLLWLLYRHALKQTTNKVVACTLTELLNEYKALFNAAREGSDPVIPRLNAAELKQSETKYSIFFDDIDKARPTEYAAEQFFEIVNAIYEYGHTLVVTTNLCIDKLVEHFDRADPRFGGAIVRRLCENAKVIEMF